MFEIFERGFLATVGMISLSREKTQEMVEELVRKGEINRDEGKQLVEKMVKRGQEEQDSLRKLVRQEVGSAMSEMGAATQQDLKALNDKIDALIQKLDKA